MQDEKSRLEVQGIMAAIRLQGDAGVRGVSERAENCSYNQGVR